MPLVYIGLGSNKGDRIRNIKEALRRIGKKIKILKVSSLYLTEPVGIKGEWFVNCALEGEAREEPQELLENLLKIEKEMGRMRGKEKTPRVIDLDLLLYEDRIIEEKNLILPHPRLHKRRFVLVPLVEINPHLQHPLLKKTLKQILKTLKDLHRVERLPEKIKMSIVRTEKLGKIYKGYKGFLRKRRTLALRGLTLEIGKGEVFGLLGLNAAGKTTALKIFLGLIFPSWGEFEILGKKGDNIQIKQRIGFLPEDPSFYDYLSAEEFLDFCGKLFRIEKRERRKRIKNLLELVDLSDAKRIRIKEFSQGMVQRLGIASALINNPELIFLDEPLSGLDPLGRRRIKDIILGFKDKGKTIFFSSHILAEVEEISDRIGILHQGRLICTKQMEELKEERISLEEFFIRTVQGIEKT